VKKNTSKKLRLNRERLVSLTSRELTSANGGVGGLPSLITWCASCGPFCAGPIDHV
jgi:hypothetical protein